MSEYFNEKSSEWDTNEMVKNLSAAIGASIVENIPLNDQMEVMDFGAGTGLISSRVAPHVKKIVALDTSEGMLDKLVAKAEFNGKVEAICHNIIDCPIDYRFDLIMSAMAMHHVEDTDKLIQRFAEHLKPGAMVALADLDKEDGSFHPEEAQGVYHSGFEREALQSILEKHGFSNVRFVTAHTVNKEEKQYPIFLAIAKKD